MNGTVLVRAPSSRLAEGIVTHISRMPVDMELARSQHAAYADALTASGWVIRTAPAADDCPDSVFIEDTVVICEDLAVLTRPGAAVRRPEVDGVAQTVRSLGLRTACIEDPGTLDGGDVLQAGSTIYVGRGGRTNGEGIRQLRALLAPLGRTVVGVPLGGDRVLIAASAPRTAELLDDLGFVPVVVDISEFEKLEGCVTCLSVLVPGR